MNFISTHITITHVKKYNMAQKSSIHPFPIITHPPHSEVTSVLAFMIICFSLVLPHYYILLNTTSFPVF